MGWFSDKGKERTWVEGRLSDIQIHIWTSLSRS